MERRFSSSIGLGHMADTSSKGSSDESTRASHDQPADASKRPFVQGVFRDRTPSLEFAPKPNPIPLFAQRRPQRRACQLFFVLLQELKSKQGLQPKPIFLDPWKLLWGK